ncbi:MAG: VWA domain-containing protein [Fibrobacteria bacterium]|nr:VWA domain-containing protein [Fibrobacteria bacterium]
MIPSTWSEPRLLWLLVLLPALWAGAVWASRKAPKLLLPGLPPGFRPRPGLRRWLAQAPRALKLLAAALLVVALASPVEKTAWSEDDIHGVDIAMVLDVSTSMQIQDVEPSRSEASRALIDQFIAGRPHDRMALVAFAGRPVTRAPLTTDRDLLRALVDETTNEGLEDGTAIGEALLMAGNRLRNSPAKSRVVVILTDGENNAGTVDPVSAARALSSLGIRIHTIGIGREGRFSQSFRLPDGNVQRGTIESRMDSATLREVARIGGGKFFRALDRDALADAWKEIDALERSKISSRTWWETHELFHPWALAAMLVLLMSVVLENSLLRRWP